MTDRVRADRRTKEAFRRPSVKDPTGRLPWAFRTAGADERAWFVADDLLPAVAMELQAWLGQPRTSVRDVAGRPAFFSGRGSRRHS